MTVNTESVLNAIKDIPVIVVDKMDVINLIGGQYESSIVVVQLDHNTGHSTIKSVNTVGISELSKLKDQSDVIFTWTIPFVEFRPDGQVYLNLLMDIHKGYATLLEKCIAGELECSKEYRSHLIRKIQEISNEIDLLILQKASKITF